MPSYSPTTWVDENPNTTPIRYKITLANGTIIAADATIELVTAVTAGTPVNATNLNKIEQGLVKARCEIVRAKSNANQIVGGNKYAVVTLQAEDIDDWTGHNTSTNTSRITIAETGVYMGVAEVKNASSLVTADFRRNCVVAGDGNTLTQVGDILGIISLSSASLASACLPFAATAGDYIEILITNSNATQITVLSDTKLSLIRLR